MSTLRVAAVSWELRAIRSDGDFFGHFHDLVSAAHEEGADVVVFPENQSLELLNLAPDLLERDVPAFLVQFSTEIEAWIDRISRSSGLTIIGGSHLRTTDDGIKQVCPVGSGVDGMTLVEKNRLTRYERENWRIVPGSKLPTLPDGRLGVTIGYDAEFPASVSALAETGVMVQVIPTFTEDVRSFQRARWCARARAVENQIYVVQASLVGELGREPARTTFGTSAILTPSIEPFPATATLAESRPGAEEMIIRTLDLDLLTVARDEGTVSNWSDRTKPWTVGPQEPS